MKINKQSMNKINLIKSDQINQIQSNPIKSNQSTKQSINQSINQSIQVHETQSKFSNKSVSMFSGVLISKYAVFFDMFAVLYKCLFGFLCCRCRSICLVFVRFASRFSFMSKCFSFKFQVLSWCVLFLAVSLGNPRVCFAFHIISILCGFMARNIAAVSSVSTCSHG